MEEIVVNDQKHEVATPFSNSQSFQKLYDIGKMFASSSLVPAAYQGKPMDCTIAVDMANRMNVNPMFVMQNLYVVKGKPSWSGQACMSMIRACHEFKDARSVYTGEPYTDTWGCYIQAEDRKTGEIINGTEVTIQMAKAEEWYGKPGSKWKTMPKQMLAYRAAAFFARVYIPNALMGCHVEGEADDMTKGDKPAMVDPFIPPEGEERFK